MMTGTDVVNVPVDIENAKTANIENVATAIDKSSSKTGKRKKLMIAGIAVATISTAALLFGAGFGAAALVYLPPAEELTTISAEEMAAEEMAAEEMATISTFEDEYERAAGKASPESKEPHFKKPAHTVWHNGTENQSHIIVKLVDDRSVHGEEEQAPDPSLPAGEGRLLSTESARSVHLSIGGLDLKATAMFPTHRRRKLEATGDEATTDPLHLFFETDAADGDGATLCDRLNADSKVEIAYLAPLPAALPANREVRRQLQSASFVHLQTYRGPAPDGFDFDEAENYPGGTGAGVTVADIEGGANLNHEDLGMEDAQLINSLSPDKGWIAHGTAVWGEIKGKHDKASKDGKGVRGGAVAVTPIVANVFDEDGYFIQLATVIADTADKLQPGDIMLIEQHYRVRHIPGATYAPVEFFPADWQAIRAAVNKGIVVVEAGGNGHMALDEMQDGRFQRGHANFADSGAIMVGGAKHLQRKWIGSSYGSRVDVQGWYDWSVATSGYGGLQSRMGENDAYTGSFSGTSSASPLVTAAAAVMQSVARESMGRVLEPDELRELMVKTGTPQPEEDAATRPIGPQPNLKWALAALSNARTQHGGCCQRSLSDTKVAPWEYKKAVPIALESRTIGCTRGAWMPFKTYAPDTETCEDLRSFEVVSATRSSCSVVNQCVYSNRDTSRYRNKERCEVRQMSAFPLQVHSFDVEKARSCRYDSLEVNGQKYCGTSGPQGVTKVTGSLKWRTDYSVTKGGFKICPPNNLIHTATLSGKTYASCQGTYTKSADTVNGKPVWDRTTGGRFIYWCKNQWRITGSQWRQGKVDGSIKHCGGYIKSKDNNEHWFEADWSGSNGATASP